MAAGRGNSLGEALADLIGQGSRPGGLRSSYTAKGWHAQLRQLTGTHAGAEALAEQGLKPRTIREWLADEEANPRKSSLDKLHAAYDKMAGRFPDLQHTKIEITGRVTMGPDSRVRGTEGHSPLRIDGGEGDWDEIKRRWEAGTIDPAELERAFVQDVIGSPGNIGSAVHYMEFDGMGYIVIA